MIDHLLPQNVIQALGWSLLHSLWQGAFLAIILGILLLFLRKFSSATRYLIIAFFMVLHVAIIPLNFINHYHPVVSNSEDNLKVNPSEPTSLKVSKHDVQEQDYNIITEKVNQKFTGYFDLHLPLIVTIWFVGVTILLLRYLAQLAYVQRLISHGVQPFPPQLYDVIRKLEEKINIHRNVKYLQTFRISSPMTVGWLKPVVLFPIGLFAKLDPSEVEAILLHELAHIKRNDYLVNVFQSLATILLFYHPATWWISGLLHQERENCCDDLVIELSGKPDEYATTLIHLQEQKLKAMKTSLSISGKKSSFTQRILRLLQDSIPSANRFREGFITAMVLVCGFIFLAATTKEPIQKQELNISSLEPTTQKDNKVDMLINAIDENDEQLFNYLLEQGIEINGVGSNEWTPLGFAASEGRLEFAKVLLDRGANINHPTNSHRTPILAAASEGQLEIVKLLIERGASVDVKANDNNALSLAAREGHLEVVQFLKGVSPKLMPAEEDKTNMLINAIDDKNEEIFNYLIDEGVDVNKPNNEGWTPLAFAAAEGRLHFVKSLIERGAKINYSGNDGKIPFLEAAREGHLDVVKLFLDEGIKVDAKSEKGTTALSLAAREGHLDVVNHLVSSGAKVNNTDQRGWAAIHYVAHERYPEVMKRLIDEGADMEMPVSGEWIDMGEEGGRKVLMENWTPLIIAVEEEHVETVKVLINAGANLNVKVGKTVFTFKEKDMKEISASGKPLYVATGWTPLMEAVEKQNVQLVKLLISNGADKNLQTQEGMSAMTIAEKKGNKDIIQLLN